jgi:hypothetical protein
MSDPISNIDEEYFISFDELIVQVANGVAEAQNALDKQSINIQDQINKDPKLKALGLMATWYQIPEVTASIKVSLSLKKTTAEFTQVLIWPFNAAFKTDFDFDFQGTSEMSFKIVPVPPPLANSYTAVPDLTGKSEGDATTALTGANLTKGSVAEREGDIEEVVSQDPAPGKMVFIGTSVDIIIKKPPNLG